MWHRQISMRELREIWADFSRRGILYNGMTQVALYERYGDRLRHSPKIGWYVLRGR